MEVTSDKADYNTVYTAVFTMKLLTEEKGIYYYDDVVAATVNGKSAIVTKVNDTTVTVSYTFEVTEELVYEIIEGMNSTQTKDSNGTITIVGNEKSDEEETTISIEEEEITTDEEESEEESKEETYDNKDDTVTALTTGDNNSFVFLGFMILMSIAGIVVARRLKIIEE